MAKATQTTTDNAETTATATGTVDTAATVQPSDVPTGSESTGTGTVGTGTAATGNGHATPTEAERKKGHANAFMVEQAKAGYVTFTDGKAGLRVLHRDASDGTNDLFIPLDKLVGITETGVERITKASDPESDGKKAIAELVKKGYTMADIVAYAASLGLTNDTKE